MVVSESTREVPAGDRIISGRRPPDRSMLRPAARPGLSLAAGAVLLLTGLLIVPLGTIGPAAPARGTTAHAPLADALRPAPPAGLSAAPSAIRPSAITSLDWDGMGSFSVPRIDANRVAGEGAAMVSDSVYRNIVLFGGRGSDGLTNLTLEVSQVTGKWTNVTGPVGPSPRANMSFADDASRGLAVLFGGSTDPMTGESDSSTWVFWYANSTWENVTHRVAPPARESAAFAVDATGGVGFLEGGWDRDYRSGSSTGTVLWNDTWRLNLTSFAWSRTFTNGTLPPMYGSAMAFDPVAGEFLMYGGCSAGCTNAVRAVNLTQGRWSTLVPPLGSQVPAPGGGSDFEWSPYVNATVMFGGFGPTTSAFASYNSTFVFDPVSRIWSYVQGPPDPSARYAAAATWLSANGCPGLFLAGGSSAYFGPPADLWFLDPNPDTGVGCNVWGNDQVGNSTGNTTGCNGNGTLVVIVRNNLTGAGVPGAAISLTGACGPKSGATNSTGVDVLTHVPLTVEDVRVSAADFHPGGSAVNVTANYTVNRTGPVPPPLWVNLTPLPSLELRTFGENLTDAKYALGAVAVTMDSSFLLGNTSEEGYLNLTAISTSAGRLWFDTFKAGYSAPEYVTTLPYTGVVWVNLTLQAEGAFSVEVVVAGTQVALPSATGTVTPIDPGAPVGPMAFSVDSLGRYLTYLPLGNYTVSASAPGFAGNRTLNPVFHPWVLSTVVVLNLTPDVGYNLSVRVIDAVTLAPIDNASVELGFTYLRYTDLAGWGNFSNVRPPGSWGVLASAAGYSSNRSFVVLDPTFPRVAITIKLTPLPCAPPGCAPPLGGNRPFSLLPGSSGTLTFLVAAPAMFLAAAVGYALYLRRRTGAHVP